MAKLNGGNFNKFTVLKNEDIENYCDEAEKNNLKWIGYTINASRAKDGKRNQRQYIVVNTDEPYIDEIVTILKRNGHWG